MSRKPISRRRMLRMVAFSGAACVLAACGGAPQTAGIGDTASSGATTAPAAAEATTAPAAGATAAPAANTGGAQGKFVIASIGNPEQNAPLIKAIEDAHPGVKVEWRNLPSERFVELFTAAEVAGDQIDLMDLNGQDLRRYALGGKLLDLSDIAYKNRFQDIALKTYTVQGKLWALPRGGISGFTFLYNKKALAKVGVTNELTSYDDFLKIAPDLMKAGIAPVTHPGKNIYLWPVWQFWAYGQTSGNQSIEHTFKTLSGEAKFTDPEHVAALETLYKFGQDKMFIDSVNSLDSDGAWLTFTQGKAAFLYDHSYRIGVYRTDASKYPDLDMSLIPPPRAVATPNAVRTNPGGTGNALAIYAKIAPERLDLARSVLDLMTSDTWVKWANDLGKDPASCNKNVQASNDELAVKYAKECAPNQTIYLDWFWPPEITRAFQENQQALVSGSKKPDEAAQSIQDTLKQLYDDGYKFAL